LVLGALACTWRCAGEGELLFALIHCGPILPDRAEGVNRQALPGFWRFSPSPRAWAGGRIVPGAEVAKDLLHQPRVNMPNAQDQVAPFL